METTSVIIVDDKDIIRETLKGLLASYSDIKVVAEASYGSEAVELIRENSFDVILMDINMPGMDGIETTKEILKIDANIKILANSSHVGSKYITDMLEAGAKGYIRKGDDIEAYKEAIWTVKNDGVYLSEDINNNTYEQVYRSLQLA